MEVTISCWRLEEYTQIWCVGKCTGTLLLQVLVLWRIQKVLHLYET